MNSLEEWMRLAALIKQGASPESLLQKEKARADDEVLDHAARLQEAIMQKQEGMGQFARILGELKERDHLKEYRLRVEEFKTEFVKQKERVDQEEQTLEKEEDRLKKMLSRIEQLKKELSVLRQTTEQPRPPSANEANLYKVAGLASAKVAAIRRSS